MNPADSAGANAIKVTITISKAPGKNVDGNDWGDALAVCRVVLAGVTKRA